VRLDSTQTKMAFLLKESKRKMNLEAKVKRIEEKLGVTKEPNPTVIIIDADEEMLGPVRDWITFQEQLKQNRPDSKFMLFVASTEAEIEARAKQRKATKNNETAQSRATK